MYSDDQKERVIQQIQKGKTAPEISKQLKIGVKTVKVWGKNENVVIQKEKLPQHSVATRKAVLEDLKKGMTQEKAAGIHKVAIGSVSHWLHQADSDKREAFLNHVD